MDFREWYVIGAQDAFVEGECPSFFPLPKVTSGSVAGEHTPTHVRKYSAEGKDWMKVGSYEEGGPGDLGEWRATPGVSFDARIIDQ